MSRYQNSIPSHPIENKENSTLYQNQRRETNKSFKSGTDRVHNELVFNNSFKNLNNYQHKNSCVQKVSSHEETIIKHLINIDNSPLLTDKFYKIQLEITEKMRAILIDWLIDVGQKFKLKTETIFRTVATIDRYLAKEIVLKKEFQLVGIATLMLISKYEEIYPPQLKDYVAVCDNAFSKDIVLEMESKIILKLEFKLSYPTAYCFFEHLVSRIDMPIRLKTFCLYILEVGLLDISILKYSSLTQAASVIFLVSKIFKEDKIRDGFQDKFLITEQQAREGAKELYVCLQKHDLSSFTAIKRKFSSHENFEVSKYKIERIDNHR